MILTKKNLLKVLLVSNIFVINSGVANNSFNILPEVDDRSIPLDSENKLTVNQEQKTTLLSGQENSSNQRMSSINSNYSAVARNDTAQYWPKLNYSNNGDNSQSKPHSIDQLDVSQEGNDDKNIVIIKNGGDELSLKKYSDDSEQESLELDHSNRLTSSYKELEKTTEQKTREKIVNQPQNKRFSLFADSQSTQLDQDNRDQVLKELQNMPPVERLTRLENIIEIQKSQHYENKIRALQEEVQELRGLLERERHKIEKSLAQQKLLYEDLDRRFTQVKNSSSSQTTSSFSFQDKKTEQQDLYTLAYQKIKQRDYPQAIELFNKYLTTYPNGLFCANSNYWLGEIYMLQSDYQKALAAFDVVLTKYPQNNKAADAMYKKGLVYIYLKDFAQAKQVLAQVKKQFYNTTVARLADKKLQGIENLSNDT